MIINEIGIKGYKSFGNNEQTLKLNTDKGQLILLSGENGNGKSALIETFEFTLYGKVKSAKVKKWAKLSTLPNRINNELLTRIKFISNSTDVEIKRGISPNKLELYENGVLNDRAGKSNINTVIEDYVGLDIETFKSFISMSINDFKNFISLTAEEKKLLLDKLFNLEVINIMSKILKELVKNNKMRMASLQSEMDTLESSIDSINRSIERSKARKIVDSDNEIEKIKKSMQEKKSEYTELKSKVEKIKQKENELKQQIDDEKKQYIILGQDVKKTEKEIALYDSGKCPTCTTSFDSEHFISLRQTLVEKLSKTNQLKDEVESNINNVKEKQRKLNEISLKANKAYNDVTYFLKQCKIDIEKIEKQRILNEKNSVDVEEFKESIKELSEKKETSQEHITLEKEKQLYYNELANVFSEEGVKRSIIRSIVKPINVFIKENIKKMGLNFEVRLDDSFTAKILQLGNEIEPDTLSTGETRRINIAILIAYLKMIRTKKHINILFLDEIFSSIDLRGIQEILILLKSFANDYNINIFVVHHAIMNNEYFDRIIQIDKNIFTTINEIEFEQ